MKTCVYIEKIHFDPFFVWLNRIENGAIELCPVKYFTTNKHIEDPLKVQLTPEKYSIIQDTERIIDVIKMTWGNLSIFHEPHSVNTQGV